MTEGGTDKAGRFHQVARIDDSRLTELFGREVLSDLVRREFLSPEWAERLSAALMEPRGMTAP